MSLARASQGTGTRTQPSTRLSAGCGKDANKSFTAITAASVMGTT